MGPSCSAAGSPGATWHGCSASAGSTILSAENYMLYTPLLVEAGSGTLEPRHVVVPLRQMCPNARSPPRSRDGPRRGAAHRPRRHPRGRARDPLRASSCSPSARSPASSPCRDWHERGSASRTSPTRSRSAIGCSNSSSEPRSGPTVPEELGFVFVGAGYAGVEALGELNDLARAALRFYPEPPKRAPALGARGRAPKILPEIPRRLGEYAARHLEKRGVEIQSGRRSPPTTGRGCPLERRHRPGTDGRVDAGVRANPLLGELGLPLDARGRVPSTRSCTSRAARTCGHSGTAPRCPTHGRRGRSIRRPRNTPSVRPAG